MQSSRAQNCCLDCELDAGSSSREERPAKETAEKRTAVAWLSIKANQQLPSDHSQLVAMPTIGRLLADWMNGSMNREISGRFAGDLHEKSQGARLCVT